MTRTARSTGVYEDLTVPRPEFLGGGNWVISNRSRVSVLFGRNGSGKSLLLRILRNSDSKRFNYTVPERGGTIAFQPQYLNEQMDGGRRAQRWSQNLSNTYREDVVARIQAFYGKATTYPTQPTPVLASQINEEIDRMMPDFSFRLKGDTPPFELVRKASDKRITDSNELSSGEVQILTLALDLLLICFIWRLDGVENGTLLIDEPDTHLHPDLQQQIARFLVRLSVNQNVPLIIATHSTTMLSALGGYGAGETSVIFLDPAVESQRAVRFDEVQQVLSTCLGGHALMGPLFSRPLLLVEGDDDYNIWTEVPRHSGLKAAVIPCNGKQIDHYQKTLELLFTSLLGPGPTRSGFVIRDGDSGLPTKYAHVRSLRLACHEAENLYLSDQVLEAMGLTWGTACAGAVERRRDYLQWSNTLEGIS